MAERVGFEPTRAFTLPVFKTGAVNRLATSPWTSEDIAARNHFPNLAALGFPAVAILAGGTAGSLGA
jgi:hypothetical protein